MLKFKIQLLSCSVLLSIIHCMFQHVQSMTNPVICPQSSSLSIFSFFCSRLLQVPTTFVNYSVQTVEKVNMCLCWRLQTEEHHYHPADCLQNGLRQSCPPLEQENWRQNLRVYVFPPQICFPGPL